jgi:hypothetical protein
MSVEGWGVGGRFGRGMLGAGRTSSACVPGVVQVKERRRGDKRTVETMYGAHYQHWGCRVGSFVSQRWESDPVGVLRSHDWLQSPGVSISQSMAPSTAPRMRTSPWERGRRDHCRPLRSRSILNAWDGRRGENAWVHHVAKAAEVQMEHVLDNLPLHRAWMQQSLGLPADVE